MHRNASPLDAALEYATHSIRVFPCWWVRDDRTCACGKPKCADIGKHPIGKLAPHGHSDATTDEAAIRKWWAQYPDANIGAVPGPKYCVFEVDPWKDEHKTLAALKAKHGPLPDTLIIASGVHSVLDEQMRGHHYWFKSANGDRLTKKTISGIELKGDGGYVLMPPSRHKSGVSYEVERGALSTIADSPAWFSENSHGNAAARAETRVARLTGLPLGKRTLEAITERYLPAPEDGQTHRDVAIGIARNLYEAGTPRDAIEPMLWNLLSDDRSARDSARPWTPDDANRIALSVIAKPAPDQATHLTETDIADMVVRGGEFILDIPEEVPFVWGDRQRVAWIEDEPLMIAGGEGLGKSMLAQQLCLARICVRPATFLGLDVKPSDDRPALYLALDRPNQIARSFRRMVDEHDRALLDERLMVWRRTVPFDLIKKPENLLKFVEMLGTGDLYIDSLGNLSFDLVKDEVGSRVNYASQLVIDSGRQICINHHNRKPGERGSKSELKALADIYGSRWLTSGCGSILGLSGEPGDPLVMLRHLKQPAEDIGLLTLQHDHVTGTTTLHAGADLLTLIHQRGEITAADAAKVLYEVAKPSRAQIERARRRLSKEVQNKNLAYRKDTDPPTWAPIIRTRQRSEKTEERR